MKLTTKYGIVEGTPEEIAALLKKLIDSETPWQPGLSGAPEVVVVPVYAAPVPCEPPPSPLGGVYAYAAPFPREKP
jgi:hypothetical protein